MSWRPAHWKANPCDGCAEKVEDKYGLFCDLACGKATAYANYEAGADALLEALKKKGRYYPRERKHLIDHQPGWVIFIPEEVRNARERLKRGC